MNVRELEALIILLDDTDTEIAKHIEDKLLGFGKPAIPFLEQAWSNSFDVLLQNRIEYIIHTIQFSIIKSQLTAWASSATANAYAGNWKSLLDGAILLARYQYPDLEEEKIYTQINNLKRDVWLELNDSHTALERVKILNHILFTIYGFSGNTTNYHSPQNSFINTVLESKRGNPLTLSIIYSVIAQSLDIPIYGVNLPEHFVLSYYENHNEVLFYINAFSKGVIFHEREIDDFLRQLKMPKEKMYYEPCNNVYLIQRMARNLMLGYEKLGYPEKVTELKELVETIIKHAKSSD